MSMTGGSKMTGNPRIPIGFLPILLVLVLFSISFLFAASPEDPAEKPPEEDSDAAEPTVSKASGREWEPPRSGERKIERREMVESQIASRGIEDASVLAAMRNVPRHWFVPSGQQRHAYEDRPLTIGHGQTISQPFIVALMTEVLKLKPGDKVLEIGTGSGYQAAILSELTRNVFTVEIVEALAKRSSEDFASRGYEVIRTRRADGYYGWEEEAPFDAVVVTCAASHIPPPLVRQLKPGGRMCIPVGGLFATQRLMLLTKLEDGTTQSETVELVRFVPMTGDIEKK
jgi:protein-L-isoaspartate(D-aspartate) O-methyltransferase